MIPRIIHQIWIGPREPPARYLAYQESWCDLHPGWEYKLWRDADCEAIIQEDYPWLAELYGSYPYVVQQSDLVRLVILHRYGGLYVDLDFECLKPLDDLLEPPRVILGRERNGMGKMLQGEDYVLTSLIVSPPGHRFWQLVLQNMCDSFRPKRIWDIKEFYVVLTSGPHVMCDVLRDYATDHNDVEVYSSEVFYPAEQVERDEDERRRLGRVHDSYAVHHYDDSWFSPWMKLLTVVRYVGHRLWRRRRLSTVTQGEGVPD